jgi:hypothetical protein
LHSWCRECANAATQAWRRARLEELNRARREWYREEHPVEPSECVECGAAFVAQRRGVFFCSRSCKDKRYRRLNRERYLAAQRRKDARRRAARKAGRPDE